MKKLLTIGALALVIAGPAFAQSVPVTREPGASGVVVQGTPNGCLTVEATNGYPRYQGSGGCSMPDGNEGLQLGANGKGDLVLLNGDRLQTGTSQVTIGQ